MLHREEGGPVRRRCGFLICTERDASLSEGMHNDEGKASRATDHRSSTCDLVYCLRCLE